MNICPHCQYENVAGVFLCKNCNKKMYTEPRTEWASRIDELTRGYRQPPALGIPHGVQKDAIQNGWGARVNEKNSSNWGMSFELIRDKHGTKYLTITDWGTSGLTGHVFDDPEEIPDQLPPEERLARFENMNFSGGNYGPGLYGRGKLIFQAASESREIIYDSYTKDKKYRLGRRFLDGVRLRQFPKALDGKQAEQMLASLTKGALLPLDQVGTRVIIVNPTKELQECITKGDFTKFIGETWWEIIHKHKVKITVIVGNKKQNAESPDMFSKLSDGKFPDSHTYRRENQIIKIKDQPYRIKRICMAKTDDPIPEDIRGLTVQRKGMKVGLIELRDMPPDLEDKFFGFIQLDSQYEEYIAESENLEHYGFSALFSSFRELKKFAQTSFDDFKRQLGYDVDQRGNSDEKAREALQAAQQRLNEIMRNLGISGLGQRKITKPVITVMVDDVTFPNDSNEVYLGDTIENIAYVIKNQSSHNRQLNVTVETVRDDGVQIELIHKAQIEIKSNNVMAVGPFDITLSAGIYPNHAQVRCVCRVEDVNGQLLAVARIPIYIGMKRIQSDEPVSIKLRNIELPRGEESSRVNYGEEIKNLQYLIVNETSRKLDIRVAIRTLDPKKENQLISEISHWDMTLRPLSENEIEVPSILVDEKTYQTVDRGAVNIRCSAVSLKDQFGLEKGDKVAKHNMVFWLNQDEPGFEIFEDREFFEGGPNEPRSKIRVGSTPNRWVFQLNVTHPHYQAVENSNSQNGIEPYIFELMAREALYLALYLDNYEPFENKIKPTDQPYEVSKVFNATFDKIVAAYY